MASFVDQLRNGTHDWISRPHSLYGWRLSGARRVHGCALASISHAGLDFLSFQCMYLEPVLAFLVDGGKPEAAGREWTPSQLTGLYRAEGLRLSLSATPPGPDALLVRLRIENTSAELRSFVLTAYGEADRRIDPEDSVDINIKGGGYGKCFLHAEHRRCSPRAVAALCYAWIADSHRGGLTNYAKFRVLRWHHGLTACPIGISLPDGGTPNDLPNQWRQNWTLKLRPGESREMTFSLAVSYHARALPGDAEIAAVTRQAGASAPDFAGVVAKNDAFWQDTLSRVPPPPAELDEEFRKLYYRAWTCIWQLVTPGFDTGRLDGLTFQEACLLVTKADHRAVMPAEWETGLGALLLAQVDAPLAAKILDAMMAAVEPDGYVPENLVSTKENMLTFITTYLQWQIYLRTRDKAWLARHYETQKRSLWAHYRNPNFKRRGPPTIRNLIYVHIGFIYLLKIAEELALPAREIEYCRWHVDETEQVVQNFWDPGRKFFCDVYQDRGSNEEQGFIPEASVQSMIALYAGATSEQAACLMRDLREKYLVGEYGIRESGEQGGAAPDAAAFTETNLAKVKTYKHSNYMFFIPGLEKWDAQLCREICMRTIRAIARNGDFHEQMRCNADRCAFGPMAVFGAYAYIECVQALGRIGVRQG